ncbi:cyclin-like protein [Lipomyces arxii]|uniref:cyclin-like protein n=1 Tax=Lipomyces arxii TaxID=56418 RepID=UPI0034CFAADB
MHSQSYPISPASEPVAFTKKTRYSPRLEEFESRAVTQMEDEYADEIAEHQKAMEMATIPDVNMMDLQPELEWHMRPYLLDFLVESHLSLRLHPQTLFLAVNLIDRYCSRRVVFKKHYQLVGCAALWIAAKYEDKKDRVPTVRELKIMCCDAYEEDMFVQMEGHVLSTLEWNIGHPTTYTFLTQRLRYSRSSVLDNLTHYLSEMCLFHKAFLGFAPSVIANASIIVAQHILQSQCASVTSEDESQCVTLLSQYIMHASSQSLQKKFSSAAFSQVSVALQDFVVRQQHAVSELPPTPPPSSLTPIKQYACDRSAEMINTATYAAQSAYITPPCSPDEVSTANFHMQTTC